MVLDLSSLEKGVASLERAIKVADAFAKNSEAVDQNEVIRAGVIQNFEFTYELAWKFIKRWLEINLSDSSIDGLSRKDLFRIAAENQLIQSVEDWFFYHKARNETSHTYDPQVASSVYAAALRFIVDVKYLLEILEAKND